MPCAGNAGGQNVERGFAWLTDHPELQKTWIPELGNQIGLGIALGLLAAMVHQISHYASQGMPSWTADARLWAEPAA